MGTILAALLPIFAIVIIGFILKQGQFPGDAFWPPAARITYFVLFPSLLTHTFATTDVSGANLAPLVSSLVLAVLFVSGLLLALQQFIHFEGRAFTSVLQGGIRHNTYVGLAAASALFGEVGVTLAAIILATLTPLVNIISVAALTHYAHPEQGGWQRTILSIVQNPLIIACFNGLVLNGTGIGLPFGSDSVLALLGRAALPLGLLVVGAGLDVRAMRSAVGPVLVASGAKLFLYPMLTALFCLLFGVTGEARSVAVMFTALSCAPSAYVLALELGGDARLMATILTAETLLAMLTIPFMLSWLG